MQEKSPAWQRLKGLLSSYLTNVIILIVQSRVFMARL